MYDSNSPILDFYPVDFEQDLNGKKQDWEAIVKIPFINEERLLKAMAGKFVLFFIYFPSYSMLERSGTSPHQGREGKEFLWYIPQIPL